MVNQFLITNGALDIEHGPVIGLVVETQCNYFSSIAFPERITAGLCVTRLGNSSVRYEVSIFRENEETASAQGHFIHVYVDRLSRKPASIPDGMRGLLRSIHIQEDNYA